MYHHRSRLHIHIHPQRHLLLILVKIRARPRRHAGTRAEQLQLSPTTIFFTIRPFSSTGTHTPQRPPGPCLTQPILSDMNLQMPPQLIPPPKALPTDPTPALLLRLMNLLMLTQITALREPPPAAGEVTEQRLLPRVFGPRMHSQLACLRCFIIASFLAALEGLVARVRAHVRL